MKPLPILSAVAALFAGCSFCKEVVNVETPRCQLQQATVDCAKLAAASVATVQNAQDVWGAVLNNGTNYVGDLLAIAAKIGSGGWEFVTCELAAMKAAYSEAAAIPASSAVREAGPGVVARIDAVLKGARPVENARQMPLFPNAQ